MRKDKRRANSARFAFALVEDMRDNGSLIDLYNKKTMQNSFNLGLLHGTLYGLTPLTPWFIGLQRYVTEGQTKGLLTFAGLFLGQVMLLVIAFFGGRELLWLWYYLEPLLVMFGFVIMIRMVIACWITPAPAPSPLLTRREGINYLGAGVLYAFCNPGGVMFGDLLLHTLPANVFLYLFGFLLIYTSVSAGMVYLVCLSPMGQKYFGEWSISRMQQAQEPSFIYHERRRSHLRKVALSTMTVVLLQLLPTIGPAFWSIYPDTLFGATPLERFVPMRDLAWLETEDLRPASKSKAASTATPAVASEIDEAAYETAYAPKKDLTKWKLQSDCDSGTISPLDFDYNIDEDGLWSVSYRYEGLQETLERSEMPDDEQEDEVRYFEKSGPNDVFLRWTTRNNLHVMFNTTPEWERSDITFDARGKYAQELQDIRREIDLFHNDYGPVESTLQESRMRTKRRALFPLHLNLENDYDFDFEALNLTLEVTSEDVSDLGYFASEKAQKSELLLETPDWAHLGGEYEDMSIIKLQSLPQEIHFPWDYPALPPANIVRTRPVSKLDGSLLIRENDVHNQSVEFLDPIALNTRFLANDPLPVTDARWSKSKEVTGYGPPKDTMRSKAINGVRRWWLGTDRARKEEARTIMQTPRDTITAKVIPGRSHH